MRLLALASGNAIPLTKASGLRTSKFHGSGAPWRGWMRRTGQPFNELRKCCERPVLFSRSALLFFATSVTRLPAEGFSQRETALVHNLTPEAPCLYYHG